MSFIVRPVRHEDINQLTDLARQFVLLNLPGDRKVITKKIEKSLASFQGQLSKPES
jgi:arginine N-succinyltransferase